MVELKPMDLGGRVSETTRLTQPQEDVSYDIRVSADSCQCCGRIYLSSGSKRLEESFEQPQLGQIGAVDLPSWLSIEKARPG